MDGPPRPCSGPSARDPAPVAASLSGPTGAEEEIRWLMTFTVASNEFIGGGKERAEYHPVVAWD
jgi:hypothetical protein